MKKTSVLIVGAGIAGITLAIYLKRANVDFILLEGNKIGGKLNIIDRIENYPGIVSISGKEFIDNLKKQLEHLDIEVTYGLTQIILMNEEGYEVKTDVDSYIAKVVVVASGIQNPVPSIKGENEFRGMGVSYCATCDGNFFKGQDVLVYGNNDVAIEEALYLANLVNKLYFVVPNEELIGDKELVNRLIESKNVEIILNTKVEELKGDMLGLSSALLSNGREINVLGAFPYIGNKTSKEFLSNLGVTLEGNFIKVDETMMSVSNKGLFAIGDIVPKKIRQLANASGDAVIASNAIISYLKNK